VVSATAALRLLEARGEAATRANNPGVWPEFSEYDCFACHHGLGSAPSWRQQRGFAGRKPGQLPWGTWYTPLLPSVAETLGDPNAAAAANTLRSELQQLMGVPLPKPEQVAKRADSAATLLEGWFPRLQGQHDTPPAIKRSLDLVRRAARTQADAGPDQASQFYLAVAAFHHALSDLHAAPPPQVGQQLRALGAELEAAFWSRREGTPRTKYDSPVSFDRKRVHDLFDELGK
jgi:hypothetical protein